MKRQKVKLLWTRHKEASIPHGQRRRERPRMSMLD